MREVDSTGTLKAGDKPLADLRKRKLIAQRYGLSTHRRKENDRSWFLQKGPVVHSTQRPTVQHIDSQARDRSYCGHAHLVWRPNILPVLSLKSSFSGSWQTSTYKKYNFEAAGIPPIGGALHPLLKVREEIRNIFLEMGYVNLRSTP